MFKTQFACSDANGTPPCRPRSNGPGRARWISRLTRTLLVAFCAGQGLPAVAGTYPTAGGTQGFAYTNGTVPGGITWNDGTALNSTLTGTPPVPVASVQSSALRLTANGVPDTITSFKLPEIDVGLDVSALTVNFNLKLSATGTAGEGFAVNFGDIPPSAGDGELGWALANGLVVGWKTYDDPAISGVEGEIVVYANRVVIARSPQTFPNDATFRPVTVRWDAQGVDVRWNNADVFLNLAVPGFAPRVGDTVAFSARTGPVATQEISIDNLQVLTTPLANIVTGGPVITEFVADNKDSYEDEDLESPDWIEVFNGSAAGVSLTGWFLTNDPTLANKWALPAITLGANQYRVIFASAKNRSVAAGQWHTTFTLPKTGGYLALVRPDLTVASEYTYGQQHKDIPYGELGAARQRGYLEVATPGKKNISLMDAGPPAEDVVFSREGGLLANPTPVALSILPPVAPGAVVRYSLGQTLPTEISPVYTTPFSITASTTVRARVFQPGRLPGPASSRSFLKLDTSLTNYNSSGSVFSSNLPVLVMDSFGVAVDATTDPAGPRPFRPSYSVMLAPDGTSGRTRLDALPDFQGRCGTHVRGESSSGFGQKSYAWELWTNENSDKDAAILGMPAESDWALHGPWSDKSMMRNYLVYSTFGEMHQDWFAPRVKFVEVFFNQEAGQPVSYSDYRGVYLLVEKIKSSSSRLGLEKTNPLVTDPLLVQGGYIFKKDKASLGSTAWTTANQGISIQSADPEALSTTQRNYLQSYINSFETALYGASFTNPATGYAKWIDVPSFIDWQWAVEISKQIDGYVFSTYFHKDRGGKMKAGPLWDFNISLGNADYAEGEFRTGWNYDASRVAPLNGSLWFPQLHKDPNYRMATFDRYWQLRNSVWSTAAIQARIEAVSELLRDGNPTPVTSATPLSAQSPAMRQFRRHALLGIRHWPNPADATTRTTFQAEVAHLKQWITDRLAWADNQFLLGSTALRPPVLTSTNAGNNSVQVSLAPFRMVQPGFRFPDAEIRYTTDGTDPRPSGYGLPGAVQSVAFLTEYGQGSWFVPTAANGGSTLALTDWTGIADPPNAASWTAGQLGFGFDTGISSTTNPTLYHVGGAHLNDNTWTGGTGNVQAALLNNNSALMVRVPFTVTEDQRNRLVSLKAKVRYDDGFVLFVNGVEAARQNIFPASPAVWNATANATPGTFTDALGITGVTVDISHLLGSLQTGTNMLAILALNKTTADTDLLCVPSLTGSLGVKPTGINAPAVTSPVYHAPLVLSASAVVKARVFVPGIGQWGPLVSSNYIVAAEPPTRETLVVSEINYAPLPPSPAEIAAGAIEASDFEFIELLNTGANPLDLTGVRLSGAVQEFNFTNGDAAALTLPPGGRVIVCGKLSAFRARYGNGARVAGAFTGNLNNTGEIITLLDGNGATLWSFAYDDQSPWPLINEGGRSIILTNAAWQPAPEPAMGANWRPGPASGGDPGTAGSLPFTLVADADDDGDGVPNLAEYAFGTNPADAGSSRALTVSADPPAPGFSPVLRFDIPVGLNADGYRVDIQSSSNLSTWAAAAPTPVNQGIRFGADGQASALWEMPAAPNGPQVPRFFRVIITKP